MSKAAKQSPRSRGRASAEAPVKILMINTVPMIYDGITAVMLNYVENMDRTGLQIDFLAGNAVEDALRRRVEAVGGRLFRIERRNRRPLRYILRLARLIRKNGYQLIHAHGNSCTLAFEMLAALLGGARVRCAHSHNSSALNLRAHKLLKPLFRLCYTHGFACGPEAGRWLFGRRPFEILNNGIDANRYRFDSAAREEYRRRLGVGDRTAIGCVAHFVPQKNHAFLIEAFGRLCEGGDRWLLTLIGDGALRPQIEALVREKGLEDCVRFTGTTRDVPQLLSAMDLMVLPSLFEGLPNVLIEWQAAGLPALVADTVSPSARLTDLIEFLPLDARRWADAMERAAPIPDRAAASARSARVIAAAGYDIGENAARLRALYLRYLDQSRRLR